MSKNITHLHVRAISARATAGRLTLGHMSFPCLLGRTGRILHKREGDGASPVGVWQLQTVYFRADRGKRPCTALPAKPSRATNAWCEDVDNGSYNRLIHRPPGEGNETFWRVDGAYDIVIPTSHNTRPRVKGLGSAIFFHLTREGASATAGCVAVSAEHMRKILARCRPYTVLVIWPCQGGPPTRWPKIAEPTRT